jgi:glycosyltransferase involved in cell wall biosynthesis
VYVIRPHAMCRKGRSTRERGPDVSLDCARSNHRNHLIVREEALEVSPSTNFDKASDPMFSVLIGTFNGARTLGVALDALSEQVTEFSYEVLVVNDGSTDTTADIARRPRVRLISLDVNRGHGHALNIGLAEAKGQFVAMMDDDCVPPVNWIQQLGLAWESVGPDVSVIGGLVEPYEVDTFNRRYVEFRRPLVHQEAQVNETSDLWTRLLYQFSPPTMRPDPRPVYFTVGANMSVRVSAAREAGGFTEVRGAGEEESLARPLRARYGSDTIRLFPSIVMQHNFHPSLRDTLRRSRNYGRANGSHWAKNRDVPSVSALLPFATLVAVVIAVVSPLSSLVILALSPYVLYRRWYSWFRARGAREAVVYPYVQATEELANNFGFLQGAWVELRSRHQ